MAPPKRKPVSSPHSTRKRKPGPKPVEPTTRQRHQVELAVAIGMSLEQIADCFELSRRTLCRVFVRELAVGQSKKLLENIVRLDQAAQDGNTAAIKAMIALIDRDERPEAVETSHWDTVAAEIEADLDDDAVEMCEGRDEKIPNLPKNSEFWKNN